MTKPDAPIQLRNIRNSCYVNTILQTLFHCDHFNEYLLKHHKHNPNLTPLNVLNSNTSPTFVQIYKLMYMCFAKKSVNLLNKLIIQFREMCDFGAVSTQQDTHEALSFILKKIHQELIPVNAPYEFDDFHLQLHRTSNDRFETYLKGEYRKLYHNDYSLISKYFSLELLNVFECAFCTEKTLKIEKHQQLILSIDDHDNNHNHNHNHNNTSTLENAMNMYFRPETIEEGKKCGNCGRVTPTTIHTFLLGLPMYLIIVLNRFHLDKKSLKCSKNHKLVDFNDDSLGVSKYLLQTSIPVHYRLKSVINHHGEMDNGHYYCHQKYGDGWFKCNDSKINDIGTKLGIMDKKDAYVFFYELEL